MTTIELTVYTKDGLTIKSSGTVKGNELVYDFSIDPTSAETDQKHRLLVCDPKDADFVKIDNIFTTHLIHLTKQLNDELNRNGLKLSEDV